MNENQAALEEQLYKLNKIVSKDQKDTTKLDQELKDKKKDTEEKVKPQEYERERRIELNQNHDNWNKLTQNPELYNKIFFDKDHIDRSKNSVQRLDEEHDTKQKYL